jgi:Fanconi-associated nuclease 1
MKQEQPDFRLAPEIIDPGDRGEKTTEVEGRPVKAEVDPAGESSSDGVERPTSMLQSRDSTGSNSSTSSTDSKGRPKESMYPTIFGEMINTVMQTEEYLFTNAERALLRSYFDMDYEARHLFARLIQRRNVWHRVDKLNYDFDVTDKVAAIASLCTASETVRAACALEEGASANRESAMDRFCLSEVDMEEGFEQPLNLLTVEELKILAKNMNRLKGVTNKASLISSLLTTRSQGTLLGFGRPPSGSTSPDRTTLSQASVLREQLREVVGGCVRVCPRVQALIDRIALVYYRGAELGGSALTTAVLSRSRKRSYPMYAWKRSERLFVSRDHLLGMQSALELEIQMEQWIEWENNPASIAKALAAFQAVYGDWKIAVREAQTIAPDVTDLGAYNRMRFHPGWPLTRVVYKGVFVLGKLHRHEEEAEVLRSLLDQKVFRRGRRGDWYDRLALITAHYPPSKKPNDVRKAKRDALAISIAGIEDPDTHLIYHDTLQRRISRLESQLNLPFSEKHDFSYAKLRNCEDRVFRGVRLDRMMGERKGIFGADIPLTGANLRFVKDGSGEAIYKAPLRKVVKVEKNNDANTKKLNTPEPSSAMDEVVEDVQVERRDVRKDMHTVWRGLDGDPCRVESLVLQHYAQDDYKGFHCEGGILTMLFALLLWDVLFIPIDGVFETPYQRQPLDLTEDTFAIVRGPQLRTRLMEIENGRGLEFIRETDERERPRRTWAVGCRWDDYSLEDLLEIAECMGGRALAVICQMLAEEWSHCAAGMPDLCVWRYADKKIRFCEVKGPGDKLSEKQKLWIDVLLRAGLHVEVSKVEERAR